MVHGKYFLEGDTLFGRDTLGGEGTLKCDFLCPNVVLGGKGRVMKCAFFLLCPEMDALDRFAMEDEAKRGEYRTVGGAVTFFCLMVSGINWI